MSVTTFTKPQAVERAVAGLAALLARHSIDLLRISLGLVFLGFGVLKFFPGASPAEALVARTIEALSFGLVSGTAAVVLTAVAECFIGITLVTGRLLKTGLVVLAGSMVGIMSPLVLFFTDLFPGTPTIEGQYVAKDIVLVAGGLVVAAKALGARLVAPAEEAADGAAEEAADKAADRVTLTSDGAVTESSLVAAGR